MVSSFVRTAVLSLVLSSLFPPSADAQAAPPPAVRLRAGDAVRLEVRDEPGLTGEFQLDESGRALLPIVGLVSVGGRDFEEVRRDVAAAYGRELTHKDVRLTPLLRIAVLGEVRQPGLYPVDPTHTLADVLARAGGLAPDADPNRVELVRDGRTLLTARAREAGALGQPLQSGDQILVGRRGWAVANAPTLIGAGASMVVAIVTALILRR